MLLPALVRAQFTFTTNTDNTITITGYTGSGGNVIVPGFIGQLPVTSIVYPAFIDFLKVKSVAIPSSVTNYQPSRFPPVLPTLALVRFPNAPASTTLFYHLASPASGTRLLRHAWMLPNPTILNCAPDFGMQTNRFGFTISWATNISVVVEACTNLADWQPVQTNTLTGGTSYFSDPQWTNYPRRYYRLRSP